ncbi:MAG: GMC family oxidoreductase [Gemmatimonadales bacterium]
MADFVVVGAGSAGAVVASRLSEEAACSVELLEAGGPAVPSASLIPAAFSRLFGTAADWRFRTEPEPELDGRQLYWPRGRMLGGSSAMNAMIWTPPSRADLDGWRDLGNPGWGWDDCEPALRRAELAAPPAPDRVGIPVSRHRTINPMTHAFLGAAGRFGAEPNDGFRSGTLDGAGLFQVTQWRGRRVSAAAGYLAPVRSRPNLTITTGALARRILFDGSRAVGVEYRRGSELRIARGRVVLAAGAVGSPHLLLASGVGPAADLAPLGITVVADLPGVGANLQDHLAAGVVFRCSRPVSLAGAGGPIDVLRYLLFRSGPLTSNVAEAGAFIRVGDPAPGPTIELLFAPVFFVDHGRGNPEGHGFTIATVLLQPDSRGRITLAGADPEAPPRIAPRYLSEPGDLRRLASGLEAARAWAAAPEFDRYRGDEFLPGQGHPALAIRAHAETLYHPVGTCRMGADGGAVVGSDLRVHGVEDLWVADASVMPRITSSHTHAPTVIIGERTAELVRSRF